MKDSNLPLISIIVPVYKVEKYLDRCLQSLVNQTYENIEIILVDDGSPDNCPAMCEEWAKRDSRIVVFHKQNGGLSSARNFGLDHARGKFISFIDSDDYVKKLFIQTLYDRLIIDKSDISVCNFDRIDENGAILLDYPLIKTGEKNILNKKEFWEAFFLHRAVNVVAWNKLYKKNIFDSLRYFEGHIHEDVFIIPEIIKRIEQISFINESLYCYLKREDSIVGKAKKNHSIDLDKIYADVILAEYFENNGYFEIFSHHMHDVVIDITEQFCENKLTKKQKVEFSNLYKKFTLLYIRNKSDFSKQGMKVQVYMRLFCFNIRLFYIIYQILKGLKNIIRKIRYIPNVKR